MGWSRSKLRLSLVQGRHSGRSPRWLIWFRTRVNCLTYLSRSVLMPSRCLTVEQSTEADVDYFSVLRGLYSSSNFTKFTLSDRITVIMSTQFLSDTVDNVERILILLLERRHLKSQIQSYSRPSWFNFGNLCRDLGQWDCLPYWD